MFSLEVRLGENSRRFVYQDSARLHVTSPLPGDQGRPAEPNSGLRSSGPPLVPETPVWCPRQNLMLRSGRERMSLASDICPRVGVGYP